MNMLQRLIGRYMPKAETTTLRSPATWFLEAMFGQRESAAGIRVSEATALSLSAYYCGVKMISGTIASLPLNVYKTDGRKREAEQQHQRGADRTRHPTRRGVPRGDQDRQG